MPQNSSESVTSQNYLERNPICENRQWLLTCAVVVFWNKSDASWKYPAKIFVRRSIFLRKNIYRSVIIEVNLKSSISAHKDDRISFSLLFLCASWKMHRQIVSVSAVNLLPQKRTLAETLLKGKSHLRRSLIPLPSLMSRCSNHWASQVVLFKPSLEH